MINLIMAVVSSCLISILMRVGDKYIKNNMAMFTANYIVCAVLSWAFARIGSLPDLSAGGGLSFAVILGVISGILYLGSFMLMQLNIKKNGVVLTATFMKLGVLVPTVMAVTLFGEQLKTLQIAGIVLAVAAIILMNGFRDKEDRETESETAVCPKSVSEVKSGSEQKPKLKAGLRSKSGSASGLLLILLLIVGGITDSLANIYDKEGAAAYKDYYLLFVFASACIFSIIMIFVRKQYFTWMDMLWGMMIGVPNYFSSRFLLGALGEMPAVIVYPVYNVAAILIICLFGMAVFKEKPGLRKLIGIGVIAAGLICLNI